MITNLTTGSTCNFEWVDAYDPTDAEVKELTARYGFDPASINDFLQVGHLPKYEQLKGYAFVIMRIYLNNTDLEADNVRELTNKVAIFYSDHYIVTMHRKEWPYIQSIATTHIASNECRSPFHLFCQIIKIALHTYDEPAVKLTTAIESLERKIFLAERQLSLLKRMYYIKRKLDVIKRLLLLTHDIIENIDKPSVADPYTRDIRDLYIKQKSLFDSLTEHINQLLNVYFNISAQKTNETIRILTIFSVFFMPLTFIVGVYGMNFKFMPELEWKWGYPAIMLSMVVVTIGIYIWFRRKKWM